MIPDRLIFIWFGRAFPYGNLLALRSARRGFAPAEILLIVDNPDALRETLRASAPDVLGWPELRLMEADSGWFDGLPHGAGAIARAVFAGRTSPATKANLIRLAALHALGGVYLDFDTITLADPARDPRALLALRGFCGSEPLALPADLFASRNPLRWAAAGARLGLRQLCAALPGGWRLFRAVEPLYPAVPNNAVLGAEAAHPFLDLCFRMMTELPEAERFKRFRLGTHLLQRAVARARAEGGLHGFEPVAPSRFYPLGPEISAHWFRPGTAAHLDAMLRPDTLIVHWYNSVESRLGGGALTEAWVKAHPDTAFAELARRFG
jgi:hypothetical protein